MAQTTASTVSARTSRAWQHLRASIGQPQWLDVPILVEPISEPQPRKIVLRAKTEDGQDLGSCAVYADEWYPGCRTPNPFSHYFPVLRYVLDARLRRKEHDPLRLQVLKAVCARTSSGRDQVVLLKFIV
ncbi:MAG: hypothetical protein ACK42I_05435, partial [Thermomicrobium sp.]